MQIIVFNVAQNGKQWSNLSIVGYYIRRCVESIGFVESTPVLALLCMSKEFIMQKLNELRTK